MENIERAARVYNLQELYELARLLNAVEKDEVGSGTPLKNDQSKLRDRIRELSVELFTSPSKR